MSRGPLPILLLAATFGVAPAIVCRAATLVHIGSREFQLGSPFDVTLGFDTGAPLSGPLLAAAVREYLGNYPDKRDYWEVVNRGLSRRLRELFPPGTRFSVTFSVGPDACYPVSRSSRLEVGEGGRETEGFEFDFQAAFSGRLHRLKVDYLYPTGCPADTIPDYRYVQQELLIYGSVHDLGAAAARRSAAAYLLARFPGLTGLAVSLDGEAGSRLGAVGRQPEVEPLSVDGDCRVRRTNPGEELVFAPAEYCGGVALPGRPNRRYVVPPMAAGSGGMPYEAEMRSVAMGLADGIVLPAESAARASALGLGAAAAVGGEWRGALVTNRAGRASPAAPTVCGAPPQWFPTCRPVELAGLALPGAACAAIVPAFLADRMALLDPGIKCEPEAVRCRLVLFRKIPGDAGGRATQ
jgi:hypothetical protein